MSVYTATMIKHSRYTLIGIGLKDTPTCGVFISSIDSNSPFLGSSLKPGMKLLTINGVSMSGLTPEEAKKILLDSEGKLVLSATNCLTAKEVTKILKDAEAEAKGKLDCSAQRLIPARITFQMGRTRGPMMERGIDTIPAIFTEAGVPLDTFCRVYELVQSELMPSAYKSYQHLTLYHREMQNYVGTQMVTGGMIGFGTESRHEKKTVEMVMKGAALLSSVDLKATQVKDRANAMLAKYSIMATFALKGTSDVGYSVIGLEFHRIE